MAQPAYFGGRVSLTNTRYAASAAVPLAAASNDVIFWATPHNVRVSRGNEVALPVLDASGDGDVVWSGAQFLVAATSGNTIFGRLLDAQGNPASAPFEIVKDATKPRLALDGDRVLLLFTSGNALRSLVLTRDGAATAPPQSIATDVVDYDVAPRAALIATGDSLRLLTLAADGSLTSETRLGDAAEHVALAGDGTQFLGMWTRDGAAEAAVLNAGTLEPFAIAGNAVVSPSLVWTGTTYLAAFVDDGAARTMSVSADGRGTADAASPSMLGAAEQSLAATASTPTAALVAWNEGADARVGIRTANGGWSEALLAAGEQAVAASSDGHEFVVITQNDSGWAATLLDGDGAVLRQSSRVAFAARGVASAATGRAVIGIDASGNVVAARVGGDGSVSAPVVVRTAAEDPAIASDGTSFFAVWQTADLRIEGVRLDSALQRIDAADILVWEDNAEDPVVAFNRDRYVVAFRSGAFVKGRRVSRDGVALMEAMQTGRLDGLPPHHLALTPLGNLTGLSWFDGKAQLVVFDAWDVQSATGFHATSDSAPRLVALPHGGVAFAHSATIDDAPHHGSERVLLSTASAGQLSPPGAPHATVTNAGGRLRVDWTAPAQAVNGYRVEYRLNDGAWLEAEGFNDGAARSMMLDPRRSGTYAIRVRAHGDGGAGAYSEPVTIAFTAGRRRAVR